MLISLVINPYSGHHDPEGLRVCEQLVAYFQAEGCEVQCYQPTHLSQLTMVVQQAISQHQTVQDGVLVVVGGDGTLNTVAQHLLSTSVRLGVIPFGTFNYVARALGIPLEPLKAAATVLYGQSRAIHVGRINQYIYLNNASIGLYPHLIEQREMDNRRFGRYRGVAWASGFAVLMRQHQKLKLKMTIDGHAQPIESPMVFFGNNQLQLADLHLKLADCATQGKLAVVAVRAVTRWQILSLIARMQLGTFEQAPEVQQYCATQIRIDAACKHMKLAIDGEIVRAEVPLHFAVAKHALQIMVPHVITSV
ncbi:MAG: diacylglycerol kinase family protein [Pseudomonadota bacterium]|nr:diacylglycerol kinase family protein [Pseudomonadota bacterium]